MLFSLTIFEAFHMKFVRTSIRLNTILNNFQNGRIRVSHLPARTSCQFLLYSLLSDCSFLRILFRLFVKYSVSAGSEPLYSKTFPVRVASYLVFFNTCTPTTFVHLASLLAPVSPVRTRFWPFPAHYYRRHY